MTITQKGYYWISQALGVPPQIAYWNGKEWLLCLAEAGEVDISVLTGPIEYDGPMLLTDIYGPI